LPQKRNYEAPLKTARRYLELSKIGDEYLDRLAEKEGLFLSEVDSSPFEHPGLLVDIGDDESLVLAEQVFIVLGQHIDDLYLITPR
jgi:hypothetical protein